MALCRCSVSKCFTFRDVVCNDLSDGMLPILVRYVGVYEFVNELCIFTVSYALLISSATVSIHIGDCFWLKSVAMVLFMLCNVWLVEWFIS